MQALTEDQVRAALVNASPEERDRLTVPMSFVLADWDHLDFFAWPDPDNRGRGYVVVDVPVAGQRQQMWVYRDGEFTTDGDRTGRRDPVVDLARVDRAALGRNLRTAGDRLRVRKPTTVYALLTRRDPGSPARFQIYAGNDVDSYGYFVTTLAGKVLEEHPADG